MEYFQIKRNLDINEIKPKNSKRRWKGRKKTNMESLHGYAYDGRWWGHLRVLALPIRGVLLKAFCRATILMTYSVPGFRPVSKQNKCSETICHQRITVHVAFVCLLKKKKIWHSTPTINDGVALACMGSGGKFSWQTTSFLVGDIIASDAWAAWGLPGEGDAVGVQGGEVDIGGWVDHRFG